MLLSVSRRARSCTLQMLRESSLLVPALKFLLRQFDRSLDAIQLQIKILQMTLRLLRRVRTERPFFRKHFREGRCFLG